MMIRRVNPDAKSNFFNILSSLCCHPHTNMGSIMEELHACFVIKILYPHNINFVFMVYLYFSW